jgi:hypothetical protein
MGFVVPPLEFHLGLPRWQHWTLQVDELDVVLYSLEKAVRLLLKSDPNIVGLLWLRESEYVHQHPAFSELRARRDIFSSQAAAEALPATRPTSSSEWRPSTSIEWGSRRADLLRRQPAGIFAPGRRAPARRSRSIKVQG